MDTDLLCVILRPRCCVCGCRSAGVGPPFKTKLSCACVCVRVCLQTRSPPDPKEGSGSYSVSGGGASLRAAPAKTSRSPPSAPPPAPRAPARRGAWRRGHRKLGGAPRSGPRARRPAGLGERPRASGASGRRRRAGSERGWAPGLAGTPGFLGAGPLPPAPLRRDAASSFPPASVRPGPGALSLHLSRRAGRGSGGASREGAARRGHPPRPRPSAGRRRVPTGAPGPAWRAGPDPPRLRSGRGGGGEPPGTERRPAGRRGGGRPLGVQGRGQRLGGDASARPAPSDPALGAEWHSPAGRTWLVHSRGRHFLSASPAGLAHPALPAAANRGACPPAAALGAPAWGPAPERGSGSRCKFQGPLGVTTSPRQDAPASVFGPRSRYVCRPTPCPVRGGEGKEAGSPSRARRRCSGRAPGSGGVGRSLGHQLYKCPLGLAVGVAAHERGGVHSSATP